MPFRHDPDEGPSAADQRAFGEGRVRTGICPDCGAEVIDDADICPRCFAFLDGNTLRPGRRRRGFFHEQWKTFILILLIVSMVGGGVLFVLSRIGR